MRVLVVLLLIATGQPVQAQVRIAVLGVGNDMDLVERWAASEGATVDLAEGARYFEFERFSAVALAPGPSTAPADLASLLYRADAAVIVVDATQGPLPINREHIILARQAHVPSVSILLANVDALHEQAPADAESLLRREAAEMRALMTAYGLDGRGALLFHDASDRARAPRGSAGGLDKAGSTLAGIGKRRKRNMIGSMGQQARGQAYLLTDAEANGRGVSIAGSAAMILWSEGASGIVQVSTQVDAGPGDVAAVSIRAQRPIRGAPGSRFVLVERDRVVGIGVLTEVGL